jgi:hypothetical protein
MAQWYAAHWALALFLASWLAVTMVYAVPAGRRALLRSAWLTFFVSRLVPVWQFFAPRPGMEDYYLLYRDQTASGEWTPWREAVGRARSQPFRPLWNPSKRERKALLDLSQAVSHAAAACPVLPQLAALSLPYLLLLNHVVSKPRGPDGTARQFLILAHSALDDSHQAVFVSGVHRLHD